MRICLLAACFSHRVLDIFQIVSVNAGTYKVTQANFRTRRTARRQRQHHTNSKSHGI